MTAGLEPKRSQRLGNKRRGALKDETGVHEMYRCQIRTAKRYYADSLEALHLVARVQRCLLNSACMQPNLSHVYVVYYIFCVPIEVKAAQTVQATKDRGTANHG